MSTETKLTKMTSSKLEKITATVMQAYNLQSSESIKLLSDAEIIRVPGIGRVALNALRKDFTFDGETIERERKAKRIERELARQERIKNGSEFFIQGARVKIGDLHNVTGVSLLDDKYILIQQSKYPGYLLRVMPEFDKQLNEFKTILLEGAFGDPTETGEESLLNGICIRNVQKICVKVDWTDKAEDFHTRRLALITSKGVTLEWELVCNNSIEDSLCP